MRAPLLVTLATNALHLGLDLVLMFQMGMGIRGAAISTATSEWLAAGAYCWLVWQRRDVLVLWPPPRVPVNEVRRRLLPFLQAGTAVVMRTGSLLGTKTLATAVAARLGPGSVASHQVLMQLWVLSSMLVDSLAVSGQTLIAVNLGKGEAGTARQISERLLQLGLGLGVGMAVLSGVSATWWPHLFTTGAPGACEQGPRSSLVWGGRSMLGVCCDTVAATRGCTGRGCTGIRSKQMVVGCFPGCGRRPCAHQSLQTCVVMLGQQAGWGNKQGT